MEIFYIHRKWLVFNSQIDNNDDLDIKRDKTIADA